MPEAAAAVVVGGEEGEFSVRRRRLGRLLLRVGVGEIGAGGSALGGLDAVAEGRRRPFYRDERTGRGLRRTLRR